MKRCVGFAHREGRCARAPDRKLNPAGLWCSNCERMRRRHLTRQMEKVTTLFEGAVQ